MFKRISIYVLLFIIFIINADEVSIDEKNKNPFEVEHEISANNYIKNKNYKVNQIKENNNLILYYGLNKNWDEISGGRSSTEPYYIYYKLPDGNYKIESILVIGKYKGDKNKICFAIIEDINGRIIGKSEDLKFSNFSSKKFVLKELKLNMKEYSNEIIIKFYAFSSTQNHFYIPEILSEESYSLIYSTEKNYLRLKNENWGIFIKTKK